MDINSKLNDVLDIEDVEYDDIDDNKSLSTTILPPSVRSTENNIVTISETPDERKDYEIARKSFKNLLETGHSALEELAALAGSTNSPRAYEVLAKLLDSITDTTERMYSIHQKVKDTGILNDLQNQPIHVDKAVFVGTSADMLNKLKEDKEI